MTPQEILALSETEFHRLVDADLRRDKPDETTWALRSPDVVNRWYFKLSKMVKESDLVLLMRESRHLAKLAEMNEETLRLEAALRDAERAYEVAREENDDAEVLVTWQAWLEVEGKVVEHLCAIEQATGKYHSERARTLRFRTGLDKDLIEAQSIREALNDGQYQSVVARERNHYAARVEVLENAIKRHRRDAQTDDRSESCDSLLWALVPESSSVHP